MSLIESIKSALPARPRATAAVGPVRVLFINHSGQVGGAERSLLLLLRGLDRTRYEPHVVCFGEGPLVDVLRQLNVPVRVLSLGAMERLSRTHGSTAREYGAATLSAIRVGWELLRHLRNLRPDVVHTNGVKAHLLGGLCARLLGRRVVWHMRDLVLDGPRGRLFGLAADLLPHRIVAVSAGTAAQFAGRRAAQRTTVVHNAVDLDWFQPRRAAAEVRAELGIRPGTRVLAMVAHFARWKGHLVFLEMLARLVAQGQPVAGLIVGSSIYRTPVEEAYEAEVRERAAQLGLQDRVVFTGYQECVADYLNAADLLVHPPIRPEPFGLAPIEAMALGKPVVASAAGGMLETVEEGAGGFLVPPGDVAGFAETVRMLVRDDGLREAMGRQGRERVAQRFSSATHVAQVVGVYGEVLSTRSTAHGGKRRAPRNARKRLMERITSGSMRHLVDRGSSGVPGTFGAARLEHRPQRQEISRMEQDQPVRLLFINHSGQIGGAERCLLLLLRGLDRSAYAPHVICLGAGPLAEALQVLDVPTHVVSLGAVERLSRTRGSTAREYGAAARSAARVGWELLRHLRNLRPDVVHTNGVKAHLLGGLCARLLGRRVLWHMHDLLLGGPRGRLFGLAADLLPHRIVAVSAGTAAQFAGRRAAQRTTVVHNAVDLAAFRPRRAAAEVRAELGFRPETRVLAMVAHFARWKGHLVFLEMLARLVAQGQPVAGLIVGSSIYRTPVEEAYEAEVRERAAELGLQDRVVFTGYQECVADYLNAADLLVHPPIRPEPFGLAPIEAMALGKPVVASAAGGMLETVEEGAGGFLVPPGDVAGFAETVRMLARDDGLREAMGRQGRERVERLFTPSSHVAQMDQIYQELIAGGKSVSFSPPRTIPGPGRVSDRSTGFELLDSGLEGSG